MTLDDATSHFVDAPGGRIHVATVGEGPPIVLIHGWPEDHRTWRDVVPPLADRYRLILPDLRGFGQSDAPPTDYRKTTMALDMLAVVDHFELERPGLVGHDWGGYIGFLLSLDHPERFCGYVACNITHPWLKPPMNPLRLLPFLYMPIVATPFFGPQILRRTNAVRGLIRGGTAKGVRIDDEAIAASCRMIREPARAEASSRLYRHFLLRELPKAASLARGRRLEIPVRMVFGTQDPAIHRSLVEGLERRADVVDYVWVENAGHFVQEEQPEVVAEALLEFFGRHAPQ